MNLAQDLERTTREFFWAHLFAFTTAGDKQKNQVKKRLSGLCDQYVALEMARLLHKKSVDDDARPSQDLLSEAKRQSQAILLAERDGQESIPQAPDTSTESNGAARGPGRMLAMISVLIVIAVVAYVFFR